MTELEKIWKQNKIPVLDVDVKGAIHVQQQYPESSLSLFINPPSVDELKRRLHSRGTETAESIQARVNKAEFELSFHDQFHKAIVNDDLQRACKEAEEIVKQFIG
jgi:guanylate kinase